MPDFTYKAELIRVVDGDTIEVRIDCGFDIWHVCTLRLDGVNCPETRGQTRLEGLVAKEATSSYIGASGLVVRTRKDPRRRKDSFRRWLAKVWVDGRDQELGEYLLATHNAVPFMVEEER